MVLKSTLINKMLENLTSLSKLRHNAISFVKKEYHYFDSFMLNFEVKNFPGFPFNIPGIFLTC